MSLKGFCPDNRIPRGLLLEGIGAIKDGKAEYDSQRLRLSKKRRNWILRMR